MCRKSVQKKVCSLKKKKVRNLDYQTFQVNFGFFFIKNYCIAHKHKFLPAGAGREALNVQVQHSKLLFSQKYAFVRQEHNNTLYYVLA